MNDSTIEDSHTGAPAPLEVSPVLDHEAQSALFNRLLPLVRRIAVAHCPHWCDPQDLCQEIFLKVFARFEQFRSEEPLEHWVARVALNTCRDGFRRAIARRELRWSDLNENQRTEIEQRGGAGSDEADLLIGRDLIARLLDTLPIEDRRVLLWIDIEQRSAAEVSLWTGWSVSLVRVRAFRARARLRRELARWELDAAALADSEYASRAMKA